MLIVEVLALMPHPSGSQALGSSCPSGLTSFGEGTSFESKGWPVACEAVREMQTQVYQITLL
jgi:hypothetical protein